MPSDMSAKGLSWCGVGLQALLRSAASGTSDAARAAAHAALAALPLSAATLTPLLLAGAGVSGPPSGAFAGGVSETPLAARQGKRARKSPAGRSRAAAGGTAGTAAHDLGAEGSEGTGRAESGAQLPALLELLHWKTDVPEAGALLAPLCVVLRALGAHAAAAPTVNGSADGNVAPDGPSDSDDEGGPVSARGCGPGRFCWMTRLFMSVMCNPCFDGHLFHGLVLLRMRLSAYAQGYTK